MRTGLLLDSELELELDFEFNLYFSYSYVTVIDVIGVIEPGHYQVKGQD